ncbi:MAG: hypothetical protein HYZ50_00040 [Deltaproteobacteria bacterium]|nr:hypothetical protein [Deltaproteobacteria bacterium]
MVRALARRFGKWFSKRQKPKQAASSATSQPASSPSVNEEEVRKRLEGLGYIE